MTEEIENVVASFLEHLGFKVERIEEGDGRTPDLVAAKGGEIFLIEVKAKYDDASWGQ